MFLYLSFCIVLFQEGILSSPLTTPQRGSPTCKGKQSQSQPSGDLNPTTLALGEPCGVYTLSCSQGLRCEPLKDEPKPLRALLEGKGVCKNGSGALPTNVVQTVEVNPTELPDEAPCRKLLAILLESLDDHLFQPHHDIYIPNCDKHGFYKKKQCWSSRGRQRGKCWCVDENGIPTKQSGNPICL